MKKLEIYDLIVAGMRDTYVRKNQDYGDSVGETFKKFGLISFVVRLDDKMSRLCSLTKSKEQKVNDESIEDTLTDLANYAILALIELKKEKENQHE